MTTTLKAMKRPDFDPKQTGEIDKFLRSLDGYSELAYRVVLRGLFPRCGGSQWTPRLQELYGRYVSDEKDVVALMKRADAVQHSLNLPSKRS